MFETTDWDTIGTTRDSYEQRRDDSAWARLEAVLPPGCGVVLMPLWVLDSPADPPVRVPGMYAARAVSDDHASYIQGEGDSFIAAMDALRAALEVAGGKM